MEGEICVEEEIYAAFFPFKPRMLIFVSDLVMSVLQGFPIYRFGSIHVIFKQLESSILISRSIIADCGRLI